MDVIDLLGEDPGGVLYRALVAAGFTDTLTALGDVTRLRQGAGGLRALAAALDQAEGAAGDPLVVVLASLAIRVTR